MKATVKHDRVEFEWVAGHPGWNYTMSINVEDAEQLLTALPECIEKLKQQQADAKKLADAVAAERERCATRVETTLVFGAGEWDFRRRAAAAIRSGEQ